MDQIDLANLPAALLPGLRLSGAPQGAVLAVAGVLALLAVAAIAFGLWRDAREKQAENEYIELPQAAELPSAASQPEQLE